MWGFLLVNYLQLIFSETWSVQKWPWCCSASILHIFMLAGDGFQSDCFHNASLWSIVKVLLVLQSQFVFLISGDLKSLLWSFFIVRGDDFQITKDWSAKWRSVSTCKEECLSYSSYFVFWVQLQSFCLAISQSWMSHLYSFALSSFKLSFKVTVSWSWMFSVVFLVHWS